MNTTLSGMGDRMLHIVESYRLLRWIFPNYPDVTEQCSKPSKELWQLRPDHLHVEMTPTGPRYWADSMEVSQTEFEALERAVKSRG